MKLPFKNIDIELNPGIFVVNNYMDEKQIIDDIIKKLFDVKWSISFEDSISFLINLEDNSFVFCQRKIDTRKINDIKNLLFENNVCLLIMFNNQQREMGYMYFVKKHAKPNMILIGKTFENDAIFLFHDKNGLSEPTPYELI